MSHAVLNRWKIRRGKEDDFAAAWTRYTDHMIEQGGAFGARLHKADDGSFVAYSWWPSRKVWDIAQGLKMPARSLMAATIEERLQELHMEVIGEVFMDEDEPPMSDASFEEDASPLDEVDEAVAESDGPPAADFDPDDPNAPL